MQRHYSTPDISRFWSKVDTSGECWEWTAGRTPFGYGKFSLKGYTINAHRIAFELVYGPIPDNAFICHHCDNPPCVRPDHLFLGDPASNTRDMANKGRGAFNGQRNPGAKRRWVTDRQCLICGTTFRPKAQQVRRGQGKYCSTACKGIASCGQNNPNAGTKGEARFSLHYKTKLTEDQVREIRVLITNGMSQTAIAASFGVSKALIRQIALRRSWKHIV